MSNGFNRKFNNLSSERGGTFKSQFFGKLQRRKLQAWSKFHFMLALCHSVCALWCTSGTLEHCKGVVYFNCADVTQVTHGFQMLQYFSWKGFWLELESTFHPCQGGDYANSKTLEIRAVASILWLAEGYSRKAKKGRAEGGFKVMQILARTLLFILKAHYRQQSTEEGEEGFCWHRNVEESLELILLKMIGTWGTDDVYVLSNGKAFSPLGFSS